MPRSKVMIRVLKFDRAMVRIYDIIFMVMIRFRVKVRVKIRGKMT